MSLSQKQLILSGMLLALSTSQLALSEEQTSDFTYSANVGFYSDYIFRGITQTDSKAAVQGGFDVKHKSGAYVGTWSSNVDWTTLGDLMSQNSVEFDFYGGLARTLGPVDYDIGILQYYYPGDNISSKPETNATEAYIGFSKDFEKFSAKFYFYGVVSTDAWGFADAQGSQYYSLDIDVPIGKTPLTGTFHVGNTQFEGDDNAQADYTDWKVNIDYTINQTFNMGVFYTDTDQDETVWTVDNNFLGDYQFGGYLSASF